MKSIYTAVAEHGGREDAGKSYQTQPLRAADAHVLAKAVCYLDDQHVNLRHYGLKCWRGSLTLQQERDAREVIKIFFDDDDRLPGSVGRPLVFGFEFTGLRPQAIEAARMGLAASFGSAYLDPRVPGFEKHGLSPNSREHFYDLAIVRGVAEYEVADPTMLARLETSLGSAIARGDDGAEIEMF